MQCITLDLTNKDVLGDNGAIVLAKQGDVGRKFCIEINEEGAPYTIEDGAQLSVWYAGPGGQGNYSAIGEASAFRISGNAVTVELAAQMLMKEGAGVLCLVLNDPAGRQIGLWNLAYYAEGVPGLDSAPVEEYYTLFSQMGKYAAQIENALPRTGGSMNGSIAMGGNRITGLGEPANGADGATRRFVEASAAAEATARRQEIAVERARIDAMTALSSGSTTGDAELADIRVGYDGLTHSGAGAAVRDQTRFLAEQVKAKQSRYRARDLLLPGAVWENKAVAVDAAADHGYTLRATTSRLLSDFVPVDHYQMVRHTVQSHDSLATMLNFFDSGKNLLSQSAYKYNGETIEIPYNAGFVRFQVMWAADGSIPVNDLVSGIRLVRTGADTLDDTLDAIAYQVLLLDSRRAYNKLPARPGDWVQGGLRSNGKATHSDTRIHTRPFPFDYSAMDVRFLDASHKFCYCAYDAERNLLETSDWYTADTSISVPVGTAYMDFCIGRTDDGVITPAEIETVNIRITDASGAHSVDIRVMNFNVGHYGYGLGNGMEASLLVEKVPNYQQFILAQACDLMAVEEQSAWLDADQTAAASQLYGPLYPFSYYPKSNWSAFHSKTKLSNTALHTFAASGRPYISADITFQDKDIHLVCVHLHSSDGKIRGAELEELVHYLSDKGRFILFGDFNVSSAEEYTALTDCGYRLANGGYMDFMNTYGGKPGYYDNIVMSRDIVLKSLSIPDTYADLTSDHLPVVCTLTILS